MVAIHPVLSWTGNPIRLAAQGRIHCQKLEHITSGAHAWKEFYEDSEQFRDVRNGYEEGIRMCKQQ